MLRDEGRDHDDAMELMALAEAAEAAEVGFGAEGS
jgi:hypothetical protein